VFAPLSLLPVSIPSPNPDWASFTIPLFSWDISVRTYALCILAGIIVAGIWTSRRLTKRGGEPGVVVDIAIGAVLLGIIGARIYHVLTHPGDYFYPGADLWKTLYIWEGGNAIFGSLLGGAVGVAIGCRYTGIRFWSFVDALAPALLLAQAIGRLGNYFNHELFGLPTDLPWGLEVTDPNTPIPAGLPEGTLFHPTFLYEMAWNTFGIVVILLLERQYKLQWGKVWALYLIGYGIGRIWFESIRIDPSEVFLGLRSNVWGAILAIVLGLVLFLVQNRNHPGREPGVYLPGREWTPEDAVDSGETYSDVDEPGDTASESSGELATSGAGKSTTS
jgi:prolipoprotein diacylglyceryl transferase